MNAATIFHIFAGSLALASVAHGAPIYRCDSADGPAFQDAPCAPRQKQTRVQLAPEPALSAPVPASAPADDAQPASQISPAARAMPTAPAPSFFLCTARDGSRYRNAGPSGQVHWVPYSMVDDREHSLAEVYGGRDGLASHASDAASIPHRPASAAPGAGYYVEVVDPCHFAAPAEACAYLRGQLGDLDGALRRAFSDTEAQLKQERAQLVEQLRGCR
jgi:hypothetical protein